MPRPTPIRTLEDLKNHPRNTLTRTEAAALLGIDPRTLNKAIHNNDIPTIQLAGTTLIPTSHITNLIK